MNTQSQVEEAEALAKAHSIVETMQSPGWSLVRSIFEEHILQMENIKDITSLKELQARQMTSKVLRSLLNDLDTIKGAKEARVQQETMQSLEAPIFKVLG